MEFTNWENHEAEVSFVISAQPSYILAFQSLLLYILNEVHIQQISIDDHGHKAQKFFIKKIHLQKLKTSVASEAITENEVAATLRQVIFKAEQVYGGYQKLESENKSDF